MKEPANMRAHSSRKVTILALGLALGLAGCASGGTGAARPAGSSNNRIVRADLDQLGTISAYSAIERLRPRWLQPRAGGGGAMPQLYIDGARRSGVDELRSLRGPDIQQMEFMSASDATTRFGTGHQGGAILVSTVR